MLNPEVWIPSQTNAKTDGLVVVLDTFCVLRGGVHAKVTWDQMYEKVGFNTLSFTDSKGLA